MKDVLQCDSVVVTHGGEKVVGMDDNVWIINCEDKEAPYPVGAGDCFVAVLALAYPFFPAEKAAEIAYEAGAIYVNTKGHSKCLGMNA